MSQRQYSLLDRVLREVDQGLRTCFAPAPPPQKASPAGSQPISELDADETTHAAGLMRINHTGEVCAQALYFGQAAFARDAQTRAHMLEAAGEETDHLAWCEERLGELQAGPSRFNPLWYAGSFAIGAAAGLSGDRVSYGFVVETERQVEAHLESHLDRLPTGDQRSRAVVAQMKADEARHADAAQAAGGSRLPAPIQRLMAFGADIMRAVAYRF